MGRRPLVSWREAAAPLDDRILASHTACDHCDAHRVLVPQAADLHGLLRGVDHPDRVVVFCWVSAYLTRSSNSLLMWLG